MTDEKKIAVNYHDYNNAIRILVDVMSTSNCPRKITNAMVYMDMHKTQNGFRPVDLIIKKNYDKAYTLLLEALSHSEGPEAEKIQQSMKLLGMLTEKV